jgi:hypothetical protein
MPHPERRSDLAHEETIWHKMRSLDSLQWRYLLASLLLLPIVDVSLRWSGHKSTRAMLARWAIGSTSDVAGRVDATVAPRIARMVSLAGRHSPWPATCLRQALLLCFFLARRGIKAELRIGVEKTDTSEFVAHAWVEWHGHVLIGGEHAQERYVVLAASSN